MVIKSVAGLTLVGLCALAGAQVKVKDVTLYYLARGSLDGAYEWSTSPGGKGTDVFTYCLSTANVFLESQPQTYTIWSISGATAASVAASGMLNGNNMPGLTPTTFLEAAAQAEFFGIPNMSSASAADNKSIQSTESNGNASFAGMDLSHFWYLEPDNPLSYKDQGQPQGYVIPPSGPFTTPGPASAIAMMYGLAGLLLRRQRARRA